MKMKIEPVRFQKLLEAVMIVKAKPLVNPTVFEFDENGATNKGVFSTVMGVYAKISKSFFLEYESKKEVVAIPYLACERIGWGFKDAEISIHTKDTILNIDGKIDHYDTEIENLEMKKLPWDIIPTDDGYLPDFDFEHTKEWKKGGKSVKPVSSFKIDAKELNLPSAKEYKFEYVDGELTVKISDGGNFSRKLTGKAIEKKDIKFALDGDYMNAIVSNLEGEILLVFDELMTLFVDKKKDCSKTYFLATQIES